MTDTPSHERVPVEAERAVLRKWAEEAARRREYDANPEAYIWDLEDENYELAAALQALTLERDGLRDAIGDVLDIFSGYAAHASKLAPEGKLALIEKWLAAALARNSEGEDA